MMHEERYEKHQDEDFYEQSHQGFNHCMVGDKKNRSSPTKELRPLFAHHLRFDVYKFVASDQYVRGSFGHETYSVSHDRMARRPSELVARAKLGCASADSS